MQSANEESTPQSDRLETEVLLTPAQVAKRLQVSPRWVRDHATRRAPRIPAVDLGARLRFRRADIEEFIKSLAARSQTTGRR